MGLLSSIFGGGGSSSSSTSSTSKQDYTDNRSVVSNDSHDYTATNSNNTSVSSSYAYGLDTSMTNSGNTYLSDARSSVSNVTDARNLSATNTNSGNTSNNSSTVVNWTGTDAGAAQIAALQAHTLETMSGRNVDAFNLLTKFAGDAIGSVNELTAQSSGNAYAQATHMLDLTGELIDKLATGTGNAVAENAAVAQSMTASATQAASSGAQMQRYMLIGGAVLVALVLLKGK